MANNQDKNQVADPGRAGQVADHGRTPMPIELRAKQFMPFAAVTGLEKALREKEREMEAEAGE